MLMQTALVAGLATSLLLGQTPANDDVATPESKAVAAVVVAPAATPEPDSAPVRGITGKIVFRGEAPAAADTDVSSDPFCAGDGAHPGRTQRVVVGEGGALKDVFVSLVGDFGRHKAPKTPVVLDQKGCDYEPHVFGIVKKQDIEILNSDDTLHNIHAVPRSNKEFNVGMPEKGMKVTKTFKKDEDAILIKCDVHPWMAAYCFSMEHPYFGVSSKDGTVSIPTADLEDGEYGVRIWHETLGSAEAKITVAGGAGTFEHTFK
jgi:plastocyanin